MILARHYSKCCIGWSTRNACLPVVQAQTSLPHDDVHQSLKNRYPFSNPLIQRLPIHAGLNDSNMLFSSLSVSFGSGHILLASNVAENGLWSLGSNAYHALGQRPFVSTAGPGSDSSHSMIRQIWHAFLLEPFQDEFKADWQNVILDPSMETPFKVNQIASGLYHSLALVTPQSQQTVKSTTKMTFRLVVMDQDTMTRPSNDSTVHENSFYSTTHDPSLSLYSWGSGFLGFGDEIYDATPRRMDCFPDSSVIDQVYGTGYYSLVIMKATGELWFWGTMGSSQSTQTPKTTSWSLFSFKSSPVRDRDDDRTRQGRVKYLSPVKLILPLPLSHATHTLVHPHFVLFLTDNSSMNALEWTLLTHLSESDLASALDSSHQKETLDYPATFESFICRSNFTPDDWQSLPFTLHERPGKLCDAKLHGSFVALLFQCASEHEPVSFQLFLYQIQPDKPYIAFHSKVHIKHEIVNWTLSGPYLYLVERVMSDANHILTIYQIHTEAMNDMIYRKVIDQAPIQFHASPQEEFLLMLAQETPSTLLSHSTTVS